jgi:sec-independent protein translocase protein TatB
MLPESGAFELLFLGIVALIVVGPKDLPVLLRKVGQFTAKMRGLAAEFRSSFDELARQSELDELRKEVDALRTGQYVAPVRQQIEQHFDDLHKEYGAPPPPALTHEGVIQPGPDAPPVLDPVSAPVETLVETPVETPVETAPALSPVHAAIIPSVAPEGAVPASREAVMRRIADTHPTPPVASRAPAAPQVEPATPAPMAPMAPRHEAFADPTREPDV